jgi:hypothetical protein
LSDSNQKYLAFIKISPNMAAKLYEPLMEFSENPITGVKLEEAYQVLRGMGFRGALPGGLQPRMRFISRAIKYAWLKGVLETFTVPLTP